MNARRKWSAKKSAKGRIGNEWRTIRGGRASSTRQCQESVIDLLPIYYYLSPGDELTLTGQA